MDRKTLLAVRNTHPSLPDQLRDNSHNQDLLVQVKVNNLTNMPSSALIQKKEHSEDRPTLFLHKLVASWDTQTQEEMKRILNLPEQSNIVSEFPDGSDLNKLAFIPLPVDRDTLWRAACLDVAEELTPLLESLQLHGGVCAWQKSIFPPMSEDMEVNYVYNPWYLVYVALLSLISGKRKNQYIKLLLQLPKPKFRKRTMHDFADDYPVLALALASKYEIMEITLAQCDHHTYLYVPCNLEMRYRMLKDIEVDCGGLFHRGSPSDVRRFSELPEFRHLSLIKKANAVSIPDSRIRDLLDDRRIKETLGTRALNILSYNYDIPEVLTLDTSATQESFLEGCMICCRRASINTLTLLLGRRILTDTMLSDLAAYAIKESFVECLYAIESINASIITNFRVERTHRTMKKPIFEFFYERELVPVSIIRDCVIYSLEREESDDSHSFRYFFDLPEVSDFWKDKEFRTTLWTSAAWSGHVNTFHALLELDPESESIDERLLILHKYLNSPKSQQPTVQSVFVTLLLFPGAWDSCEKLDVYMKSNSIITIPNVIRRLDKAKLLSHVDKCTMADILLTDAYLPEYESLCRVFAPAMDERQTITHVYKLLNSSRASAFRALLRETTLIDLSVYSDNLYLEWKHKLNTRIGPANDALAFAMLDRPDLPCPSFMLVYLIGEAAFAPLPYIEKAIDACTSLDAVSESVWENWIKRGSSSVLDLLLAKGIPKGLNPAAGDNFLICKLSEYTDLSCLVKIIKDERVDCNARGGLPLLNLVKKGSAEMVLWLLEQGAILTEEARHAAIERQCPLVIHALEMRRPK